MNRKGKGLFTRGQRHLACDLLEKPVVPVTNVVKVRMSELRDVLSEYGIVIYTRRRVGYSLAEESREKLKELLA